MFLSLKYEYIYGQSVICQICRMPL